MYASRGSVEQVYSELFGDLSEVVVEDTSSVLGTVDGKLGQFLAVIRGEFSGEITESEIKSINFDEEMLKAKRLANEILSDNDIPRISDVTDGSLETNRLYRFSGEVSTKPFESEVDGETYIEVSGEMGGVRFRGDTSLDNWGLRSHIIQSVRAAKRGDVYPYQGLIWPLTKTGNADETVEYDVDFVIICGPERTLREDWYDRRTL